MLRCTICGAEYEVSARVLMNPEAFMAWRDVMAARHKCGKRPPAAMTHVLQFPSGGADEYFARETRRLMPACPSI
jgi:hypothetical protein